MVVFVQNKYFQEYLAAYDCFCKIRFENWFLYKNFINRLNRKCVWMKPQVWRTQYTSRSSVHMRNISQFFFLVLKQ